MDKSARFSSIAEVAAEYFSAIDDILRQAVQLMFQRVARPEEVALQRAILYHHER